MNAIATALRPRLACRWIDAAHLPAEAADDYVLGAVQFGGDAVLPALRPLPHARLNKPALAPGPVVVEVWSGAAPVTTLDIGPVRCGHNGETLFGVVSVELAALAADALGDAAYAAYRAALECLQATGYPHLLRVWNSIPDINRDDAGLERYRRFNLARFRAFQEAHLPTHTGAPAATALGTFGGPLVIQFLAARSPATAIENPRQVSAYHYPQQYGPRAPNFSRAALWRAADGPSLFISGTASIVGHETQHRGDVAAQTRETLVNLDAICQQARRAGAGADWGLNELALKVYVRHARDLDVVRAEMAARGIDAAAALYLHADICRADLLVEIEAFGAA